MIKVWLLFIMISNPGLPSVKTQSFLYADEHSCMTALADYLNIYEAKPLEYKNNMVTSGYCLPFEAFPIQGLNSL
tara:strand:- start:114 stop:338 length:225 start_codon:yes stop_codon:yes gene_type:complete